MATVLPAIGSGAVSHLSGLLEFQGLGKCVALRFRAAHGQEMEAVEQLTKVVAQLVQIDSALVVFEDLAQKVEAISQLKKAVAQQFSPEESNPSERQTNSLPHRVHRQLPSGPVTPAEPFSPTRGNRVTFREETPPNAVSYDDSHGLAAQDPVPRSSSSYVGFFPPGAHGSAVANSPSGSQQFLQPPHMRGRAGRGRGFRTAGAERDGAPSIAFATVSDGSSSDGPLRARSLAAATAGGDLQEEPRRSMTGRSIATSAFEDMDGRDVLESDEELDPQASEKEDGHFARQLTPQPPRSLVAQPRSDLGSEPAVRPSRVGWRSSPSPSS